MKIIPIVISFCLGLLLVSCAPEFDREWENIDEDMIRPMDFTFETADVAPGDTVVVHAWFAGKDLDLMAINWEISWDIVTLEYGEEKPFNIQSLNPYMVEAPTIVNRASGAQVVRFSFEVPEDVLETNIEVQKNFKEFLEEMDVAGTGLPTTISGILGYMNYYAAMSPAEKALVDREEGSVLNALSQIFTSQFRLYARYDGLPSTYKQHGVRMNRKLDGINGVYVNKNPLMGNMRLYSIPGDVDEFDKTKLPEGTTVTEPVGNVLTYVNDPNRTLVLSVDVANKDSLLTLDGALEGGDETKIEEIDYVLYKESLGDGKLFSFTRHFPEGWLHSPVTTMDFFVELDDDLVKKHGQAAGDAVLFLKIYDEKWGVSYRPQGTDMREIVLRLQ